MGTEINKNNNYNKSAIFFILGVVILDVLVNSNVGNIVNMLYPLNDNLDYKQKSILIENQFIVSVILKNIFPIILATYTLLLSVEIIVFKNMKTKYLKFPILLNQEISGNNAVWVGLIINLISIILLSSYIHEILYSKSLF